MPTVLIVDDEFGPRESLRMILKDEFNVVTADSGSAAADAVRKSNPDAILLDIRLGREDGIEVLRTIRSINPEAQAAMITAYASVETARLAMQLGAVDYLIKPFDIGTVRQVVRSLVARRTALHQDTLKLQKLQEANAALTNTVWQYQEQMQNNHAGTVVALISAIDAKDRYTRDHSIRVSLLSQALAEELGLSKEEIRVVRIAGLIHDIGKIGISENVLRKIGKLTPEEWQEMKTHPVIGADIIAPVPTLAIAMPGVLQHHERPDGRGYPEGLAGNAISEVGSILAVADGLDAMSSDRTYRKALDPDRVMDELLIGSGTQWSAEVINAAIRIRLPRRHQEFQAPPGKFPFDDKG